MRVSNAFEKAIQQLGWSEPCRICGEMQGREPNQRFVGYSQCLKSRSAHDACFRANKPRSEWKLQ